jgi:small basic protein
LATTVTDLHERLRRAGMPEEQAFAVIAAFESLDRQIGELRTEMHTEFARIRAEMQAEFASVRAEIQDLRRTLRVHSMLMAIILAAVLAPYVGVLFGVR